MVVNTAAASYRLVDRGQQVFERAAIVGRRGWPTAQLDSVIDRLEFIYGRDGDAGAAIAEVAHDRERRCAA